MVSQICHGALEDISCNLFLLAACSKRLLQNSQLVVLAKSDKISYFRVTIFDLQYRSSGVTTMGSDRENPGAPNLNGPNGGPQI
jgi:hypothetical protein